MEYRTHYVVYVARDIIIRSELNNKPETFLFITDIKCYYKKLW